MPLALPRLRLTLAGLLALSTVSCRVGSVTPAETSVSSIDSTLTVGGRPVPPALLNRYVAEREGFTSRGGEMRCAYTPLGVAGDRVFLNALCLELVLEGDSLAIGSGRSGAFSLRVATSGDTVRVVSHERPIDRQGHGASIRRIFPSEVADRIFEPVLAHNARVRLLEAYLRGEAAFRLGLRPQRVRSVRDGRRESGRRPNTSRTR